MMTEQILVPLKRHDRLEEIIPYLEKISKPGMRVVFLIPYPVETWLWFRDHWVATESTKEAILAGRTIMHRYSWDVQRGLAEQKVFPARGALEKRGVEMAVEVYAGSLKKVVKNFTTNGDVHLILMRVGNGHLIMRFLRSLICLFGLFKRPNVPPMVLLNPDRGV